MPFSEHLFHKFTSSVNKMSLALWNFINQLANIYKNIISNISFIKTLVHASNSDTNQVLLVSEIFHEPALDINQMLVPERFYESTLKINEMLC